MKRFTQLLYAAGFAAALSLTTTNLSAQDAPNNPQGGGQGGRNRQGGQGGPGNFDPAQMRQRMMERYREQLGVKDDAEWKLISERIEKVTEARMAIGFRGMGFGGGGGRGGRGPGGAGGGDAQAGAGAGGGGGQRRNFPGAQTSPEAEALQKAIDADAPADEIKSKLSKYRQSNKDKEAKLETAQDELRKVLSVKQEAAAVLAGLLK